MPTSASKRLQDCANNPRFCEVKACPYYRTNWGRYCDRHDKRAETTGHPEGRTIRLSEVRPYRDQAARYIDQHRNHPKIARALEWLERLIYGQPSTTPTITPKSRPETRVAWWLVRLKRAGVTAEEVMAMVVGLYWLREAHPRQFLSDRHWDHMVVIRILRLLPSASPDRGWGKHAHDTKPISVGVRDLLSAHLRQHIGLTCLEIAELLQEAAVARNPFLVPLED